MKHVACRVQSGERQGQRVNLLGQSCEFFAGDFHHFSLPLRRIARGGLPAIFLHPHTTSVPWRCVRFLVYSEQVFFLRCVCDARRGWVDLGYPCRRRCRSLQSISNGVTRSLSPFSSTPSPLFSRFLVLSLLSQTRVDLKLSKKHTHTHTPAESTRARHRCAVHSACSQRHPCAMGYPILL